MPFTRVHKGEHEKGHEIATTILKLNFKPDDLMICWMMMPHGMPHHFTVHFCRNKLGEQSYFRTNLP